METSDQLYRLADSSYQNLEALNAELKTLTAVSKNLFKAMEATSIATEDFMDVLETIGRRAASIPGGTQKLGSCIREIASVGRNANSFYADWVTSVNTDFIVPLESKLERNSKDLVKEHQVFNQECRRKESITEKSHQKLKAIRKKKKPTRENMEKETQISQVLVDQQEELHTTRVEGLRKALLEHQKLCCFLIEHMSAISHSQIQYCASAHEKFSMKVNEWSALSSNPNELFPESLVLLRDPQSPLAFSYVSTGSGSESEEELVPKQPVPKKGHNDHVTAADIRKIREEMESIPPSTVDKASKKQSTRVKAMFAHESPEPGQLHFKVGDLIDAINETKDGWQFGTNVRTSKTGWFPAQYVDRAFPTPETRRKELHHPDPTGVSPKSSPRPPRKQYLPPQLPERDYAGGNSPVVSRSATMENVQPPNMTEKRQLSFSEQIALKATKKN